MVATQSVHDITVRDCLLWPEDHKKRPTTVSHDDVVYVSLKQQQQNQQQQCKSATEMSQMRPSAPPADDGTVGDALRGWPRYMMQCEQLQQNTDINRHEDTHKKASTKTKTGQATKAAKFKLKLSLIHI